jgi:putative membrane protein
MAMIAQSVWPACHAWAAGWGGWFLHLLGWALVLGLVAWTVVTVSRRSPASPRGRSATEILDERYARGELTGDEYRERREALR